MLINKFLILVAQILIVMTLANRCPLVIYSFPQLSKKSEGKLGKRGIISLVV